MTTPSVLTFDAEGRAVDFEVWLDDLQLFLQCDRADGLSLFYLTSGVSPAPPATADSTVRSQWATRDAAARLAVRRHLPTTERAHFSQYRSAQTLYDAVVARYSSPATAALSRLFLPYLFPDLAAFPTVADLITHLRTSDTRYRAALPAEFCARHPPPLYLTLYYVVTRLPDSLRVVRDHFLSVCPTTLTVDLLEERLLVAEQSIVAVGASRGDPCTPIFEGCSPSPLLPSVASAAAADLGGFESVGAASAPSGSCRTGRSKGGRGARWGGRGGGGGGGGSGGSGGGGGGGGGARVRGQGHERYFLLVVDDYSRYTTVFPLRSKGEVTEVLIDWIRAARLRLRESFGSDFPVLRLHSDRGGEFSSARLGAFCRAQGIRQTFTLPASPQQNGIAERRIGMYTPHQLNLQPRVSLPETSPTLLWTGKVGDASAFRVWGSRAFVRDLSADKLSPLAVPCVFLAFPPDAPGWQFYHPTSRRVLSSQDVTFDESVPYYRLFPYRAASLPPPPLFLAPGPPPVDPLPPQGPAPSGVSQVDAVEPVEVAVDSGAATGTEHAGAGSGGAGSGGAETEGAEPGGAGTRSAEPGGAASGGVEPWGAAPEGAATGGSEPGGAEPGVTEPGGAEPGGTGSARVASRGVSSPQEVLSPQELHEWFARRWSRAAGAGGPPAPTGSGGACLGGAGAAGPGGTTEAAGVSPTGGSDGASGGSGAAGAAGPGAAGATGVGVAGGVGAGGSAGAGPSEGTGAGAPAGSPGAVPAGSGGALRPRPYFVPLLEQVLGLPPSPGPAPPVECPQPVQSQSLLQPVPPLPAPSPYTGPTGGLAERRVPESRPASPAHPTCTSRRTSRPRPPAVPGTHQMTLRPSTAPLRVPLPSPPVSSLPAFADPESDSLRVASPTVARFLATVVTDPSLASIAASALVAELVDFAARCRLDYAASLVAESASVCPPSVGGECALTQSLLTSVLCALSSCEAEIYAGAMAAQELRWLTYLLTDLGEQPRSPPVLYVDNKAMLALCREHRLEHRTKHIALRYFLARELQQRGQLRLAYVASEANTADIFTKALAPSDHQRFCTLLACFALLDWSCFPTCTQLIC
ncbi:unnamed protein product [Closterium sp. NIES-53]